MLPDLYWHDPTKVCFIEEPRMLIAIMMIVMTNLMNSMWMFSSLVVCLWFPSLLTPTWEVMHPLHCCLTNSGGLGWVAKYMYKEVEQKNAWKTQHMLYIFLVVQHIAIYLCGGSRMSNMTYANTIKLGPSPFNSSPQGKKKLFTSSFQAKFLKIRFTKFTCTWSFLMYM